eukprot:4766447-Amphidinium_carterae.3
MSVRKSIRTTCIGSERAAEDALAVRLVERMKGEPLMRQFESGAFTRAFFKVSRRVKQWHTGGLEAIIARGCFRTPLSAFRALAWLKDEPPQVLPLLIIRNLGTPQPETRHAVEQAMLTSHLPEDVP